MILEFVGKHYRKNWVGETRYALMQCPVKCFIAVQDKKVIGFSCYDASALGYFGPIGMEPGLKGKGIGKALLLRTLYAMKEAGYGYAIIGWVD